MVDTRSPEPSMKISSMAQIRSAASARHCFHRVP
jgi:hypothetical protein